MAFLSALAALLLCCCCFTSAYLLVLGLGQRHSGSARLCATLALAYGGLITLFELLVSVEAFNLETALPLWVLLTVLLVARGSAPLALAWRWDVGRARVLARRCFKGVPRWLLVGAALVLGARLLRGLAAPPLAWDSLTYHLVKAARWVQTGSDEPLLAPDAWGYYQFFLPYGDVVSAWALLPAHGDDFLALSGLLVWSSVLVGAYGLARALGARRRNAVPAAAVTALLPAVVSGLTSAYVDNTLLGLFLLGLALMLLARRSQGQAEWVAAAVSLGVIAGVKPGGVPVLGLVGAMLVLEVPRLWRSGGRLAVGLGVFALLLAALPYLRTWLLTGSPLYPYPFSVGGVELSRGNTELRVINAGGALHGEPPLSPLEVLRALLLSRFTAGRGSWDHLGLGPALLLAPVGLGALGPALRRRRWEVFIVLGCGLSSLLGVMSRVLWTVWPDSSVRFLTPLAGSLLVLGALRDSSRWRLVLWLCLAVQLGLAVPRGWSEVDGRGVLGVAPPVLLALAVAGVALWQGVKRGRAVPGVLVAGGVLAASAVPLSGTRESLRYDFYAAAAELKTFELHPIWTRYSSSWPLWRAMDGQAPRRIAVSAGWGENGHNWLWYPLMGRRLQNTLTYVPVLPEGQVGDYALPDTLAQAEYPVWLEGLRQQEVEYVVTLAPPPPEAKWMTAHPELFAPLVTSATGESGVWQVKRAPEAAPH